MKTLWISNSIIQYSRLLIIPQWFFRLSMVEERFCSSCKINYIRYLFGYSFSLIILFIIRKIVSTDFISITLYSINVVL
jgi:hypothetical protein